VSRERKSLIVIATPFLAKDVGERLLTIRQGKWFTQMASDAITLAHGQTQSLTSGVNIEPGIVHKRVVTGNVLAPLLDRVTDALPRGCFRWVVLGYSVCHCPSPVLTPPALIRQAGCSLTLAATVMALEPPQAAYGDAFSLPRSSSGLIWSAAGSHFNARARRLS
jgi:hypothetical protein